MSKLPEFKLTRSRRKSVSLIVHHDNQIEVRCPHNYPLSEIERILTEKSSWLEDKMQSNKTRIVMPDLTACPSEKLRFYKNNLVMRIENFMQHYQGPHPNQIMIRRQKTRWGSCSARRNISINLMALFLPDDLFDYLMYHELTHLSQMNHGKDFWLLLESQFPGAREYANKLKKYRLV